GAAGAAGSRASCRRARPARAGPRARAQPGPCGRGNADAGTRGARVELRRCRADRWPMSRCGCARAWPTPQPLSRNDPGLRRQRLAIVKRTIRSGLRTAEASHIEEILEHAIALRIDGTELRQRRCAHQFPGMAQPAAGIPAATDALCLAEPARLTGETALAEERVPRDIRAPDAQRALAFERGTTHDSPPLVVSLGWWSCAPLQPPGGYGQNTLGGYVAPVARGQFARAVAASPVQAGPRSALPGLAPVCS